MTAHEAGREAQLHWLALHLTPGLGARSALRLVEIFGHPERVFHSSLSEVLAALPRLPKATAESIHAGIAFEDAADELRKATAGGVEVIPHQDPRYPPRLKQIYDPPLLLYALGRTELLDSHQVAVVGTRRPTQYGRVVAQKLGKEMCSIGLTLVSGMARGIDGAAHRGALDAGGATVAVLGTGVDEPYPRENRKLYDEIKTRGLVISEFPIGTTPFPQNFPLRNRIISGMSYGVVVIEGAQYSGSLITARLALEQGREVMATPGNITNKQSWGPNLLIKDGAKLIQEAADILEELPLPAREALAPTGGGASEQAADHSARQASLFGADADPLGKKILLLLRVDEALHIDEIIRKCEDESSSEVLAALSELELCGIAKQLPGKNFVLAIE